MLQLLVFVILPYAAAFQLLHCSRVPLSYDLHYRLEIAKDKTLFLKQRLQLLPADGRWEANEDLVLSELPTLPSETASDDNKRHFIENWEVKPAKPNISEPIIDLDTHIDSSLFPQSDDDENAYTMEQRQAEIIYEQLVAAAHELSEENPQSSWFQRLQLHQQSFRLEATRGVQCIQAGRLIEAVAAFDRAATLDPGQPLPQRGILAYCLADFPTAIKQFQHDIELLEKVKDKKATEIRLWLSASYRHLGQIDLAIDAIDPLNKCELPCQDQTNIMNLTSQYFVGKVPIEEMLMVLDQAAINDPKDQYGAVFYTSMYLALFFDSSIVHVQNVSSSTSDSLMNDGDIYQIWFEHFLSALAGSHRMPEQDMWHHMPRILYRFRFDPHVHYSSTQDDIASDYANENYIVSKTVSETLSQCLEYNVTSLGQIVRQRLRKAHLQSSSPPQS